MGIREDYQALMEKQLNEWKAQTERFKAGAAQFEAQAKAQYEKTLNYCGPNKPKRGRISTLLKSANEGAWSQFKAHMDKAGQEVKAAVEEFAAKLKK